MNLRFADPWLLLLFLLPLLVLLWRARGGGGAFGGFTLASGLRSSRLPLVFRCLAALGLACLVVAAARPQYGRQIAERTQTARDLVLVIDLSGSMQVDDIAQEGKRGDRLAAVIHAAKGFVERRPDDRIGLVFFADHAIASCPPTTDHATVREFLEKTEEQQRRLWARRQNLLGDATNLGLGMGNAAKMLRDPKAKGRAMILVTDGADSRNLPNWVDPLLASRHATTLGVRVHGIGVGDPEGTMTQKDLFGRVQSVRVPANLQPDHNRLSAITTAGGGRSWRAEDAAGLEKAFRAIDALEPTERLVRQVDDYHDRFLYPLIAGLVLLALAFLTESKLKGVA